MTRPDTRDMVISSNSRAVKITLMILLLTVVFYLLYFYFGAKKDSFAVAAAETAPSCRGWTKIGAVGSETVYTTESTASVGIGTNTVTGGMRLDVQGVIRSDGLAVGGFALDGTDRVPAAGDVLTRGTDGVGKWASPSTSDCRCWMNTDSSIKSGSSTAIARIGLSGYRITGGGCFDSDQPTDRVVALSVPDITSPVGADGSWTPNDAWTCRTIERDPAKVSLGRARAWVCGCKL